MTAVEFPSLYPISLLITVTFVGSLYVLALGLSIFLKSLNIFRELPAI
jgi:hypothetical protein